MKRERGERKEEFQTVLQFREHLDQTIGGDGVLEQRLLFGGIPHWVAKVQLYCSCCAQLLAEHSPSGSLPSV